MIFMAFTTTIFLTAISFDRFLDSLLDAFTTMTYLAAISLIDVLSPLECI
jgi:hypothetical protein